MSDDVENRVTAMTGAVWPPEAGTSTGTYIYGPEKKKEGKIVRLPSRFTKKVLVAFVDEDNPDETSNIVWAANLEPEMIEMINKDGETYLSIKLSLEDVYGNLEDPDED